MKNSFRIWRLLSFFGLSLFLSLVSLQVNQAQATSRNLSHELGVYSLYEYQWGWKGNITASYEADPAGSFWDLMTNGTSRDYAHRTSKRRINSQVNRHTIFPIPGDGWKDWDSFDMVFFYGHNNMITAPNYCQEGHVWSNSTGLWIMVEGNNCDWGTPVLPFEYYVADLVDGRTNPGAVVYLHDAYTSALIGSQQFNPEVAWPIQHSFQDTPAGNSPGTMSFCTGGLGSNDLEWLILHGCQAVIVANEEGFYHPIGVNTFRRAWDGFHLILGHYKSFSPSDLRDLSPFADALKSGMPVQAAYFLTDPAANSSAISAEGFGDLIPDFTLFNWALRNASYMNTDTWTAPKADLTDRPNLWYMKWIRPTGTTAGTWTRTD